METYYSQHGEDFLLNKIFDGKVNGYYVEIGCLDGIEFSNTYFFEKKGWRGACIEAHQDFIASLKKNRLNASVVHAAVGEENKESVTFYANKIGSLSTLDRSQEERWKKNFNEYFYGFEEQKVRMSTLTTIFDELKVESIDFVSLDIEGYEVQALSGLDFAKYKPTLFVIEYKDEAHQEQINGILLPRGYHYLAKLGCNMFYSLEKQHKKIITGAYGTVPLLQIDMDGREIWHSADQLSPTIGRKIMLRLKRLTFEKVVTYIKNRSRQIVDGLKIPSYKTKRSILDKYRRVHDLKVFVETGTFLGDTIAYFKNTFDQLYSIELSEELFSEAKGRFKNEPNVTILHGDSGEVLKDLVNSIDRPALYWLDGHYSSEFLLGDRFIKTARGAKVTPVVKELEILLNDKYQHVILIDDARLFKGQSDYPTIEEIFAMVKNSPYDYRMSVTRDIIRIVPFRV